MTLELLNSLLHWGVVFTAWVQHWCCAALPVLSAAACTTCTAELSPAPPWPAQLPQMPGLSLPPLGSESLDSMRGWTDPHSSLGRECSCLHGYTKARCSQVPNEFHREDKPLSFLLCHDACLGLAPPSRAAHVVMANPVPEWPLAPEAS